ncbi:hypothetical protein CEUSTIGMA_g4278.t1 [Chlamydomonas eustigma]|uniref:Uncharacterized protein n=1 Tax=Chlamydomonas eustigma TaxID=1157962 RepID=A0A250X1R9_9CHLO|nr:hypothetical protein CEUSTIGMA_g4278.t1 [Chlamydomonas eustigma]|eukprot:GAX76832.1 hypothetical protein CEUSTIGMA_g4278.t1 [Chlamydomonas eustigma]
MRNGKEDASHPFISYAAANSIQLTPPSTPAEMGAAAEDNNVIHWTVGTVFWTLGVFLLAGLAEIGGGWLVWQGIREGKPWYYVLSGCIVLALYGFVPTLQPPGSAFARVYAVYGGVFIVLSYLWGWALDGDRPDVGDGVGASIAIAGVAVAWFWPRG